MSRPLLIGEIVEHAGALCIQTGARVWYPLEGNSGLAVDFCDAFGRPLACDIGKRVYRVGNGIGSTILQMENNEQRDARLAQ